MKTWMVLLCSCLLGGLAFAETIKLKSGESYEGTVIDRNDQYVTLQSGGAPVYLPIDNIDQMAGGSAEEIHSTPALEQKSQAAGLPAIASNSISVGDKKLTIEDSLAVLGRFFEDRQIIVYFFAKPLTDAQRSDLTNQAAVSGDLLKIKENSPVLKLSLVFKKNSVCSQDNVTQKSLTFLKSELFPQNAMMTKNINKIGLNELSCSFDGGSTVKIVFKNKISSDLFLPSAGTVEAEWNIAANASVVGEKGVPDSDEVTDDPSNGKPPVAQVREALKAFLHRKFQNKQNCQDAEVSKLSIYKIGDFTQDLNGWPVYALHSIKCKTGILTSTTTNTNKSDTAFTAIVRKSPYGYECFVPEMFEKFESQMQQQIDEMFK